MSMIDARTNEPRVGPDRAQPDLHRELAPVLAPPEELPPRPHGADSPARRRSGRGWRGAGPGTARGTSISTGWPSSSSLSVAEERLHLGVGQDDRAVPSDHDHPVREPPRPPAETALPPAGDSPFATSRPTISRASTTHREIDADDRATCRGPRSSAPCSGRRCRAAGSPR